MYTLNGLIEWTVTVRIFVNQAYRISRKLPVFGRKLEGGHFIYNFYFAVYFILLCIMINDIEILVFFS